MLSHGAQRGASQTYKQGRRDDLGGLVKFLGGFFEHFLYLSSTSRRPVPVAKPVAKPAFLVKAGIVYKIPYRRARAWPSGASKGILHTKAGIAPTNTMITRMDDHRSPTHPESQRPLGWRGKSALQADIYIVLIL